MNYSDFEQYNGLTPAEFLDACEELKDNIKIIWISGDYDDDERPEANVYFRETPNDRGVCIGHFVWSDEHQWDKEYATFSADDKEWF